MSTDMTGEALPATNIDAIEFAVTLRNSAEWRREKADEFPDDRHRNLKAADLLESLADSITDLDEEELAPLSAAVGDYDYFVAETVNDYIGRIGFDHFPADAGELVRDLTARLVGEDA